MLGAASCAPANGAADDMEADGADENVEGLSGNVPVGSELEATGNVNLRASASTSGNILGVLAKGTKVKVVSSAPSNGFYNIDHLGTIGWSSGKYLQPTGGVSGPLPNGTTLVAQGDVNLRSGPGTSFAVIDVVTTGSSVTLLDPNPQNGFYNIDHQGNVGWSSSKFFTSGSGSGNGTSASVLTFKLTHGAFPTSSHPDVAVHFPPGFSPSQQPSLVAFFHGWDNCVKNAIGAVDSACAPGGPKRVALHLAEQLDAAKVNAVLVAVELAFDTQSGAPGKLANAGEFKAMLVELIDLHLNPLLSSPLSLGSMDRIVLASHSGGYTALAKVIEVGGVPVDEVVLYDSLYGQYPTYSKWIKSQITRFSPNSAQPLRFSNIWTSGGGTATLSKQLEQEVATALGQAGLSSSLFYQSTTSHTPNASELAHPVVFAYSGLSHYGVPLYFFQHTLEQSGMRVLP
jgi:uncharacterized protein YraI